MLISAPPKKMLLRHIVGLPYMFPLSSVRHTRKQELDALTDFLSLLMRTIAKQVSHHLDLAVIWLSPSGEVHTGAPV